MAERKDFTEVGLVIPKGLLGDPYLNSTQKLICAYVFSMRKDDGWCYDNEKTIGKALNLNKSTVSASAKYLKEMDYLEGETLMNKKKFAGSRLRFIRNPITNEEIRREK